MNHAGHASNLLPPPPTTTSILFLTWTSKLTSPLLFYFFLILIQASSTTATASTLYFTKSQSLSLLHCRQSSHLTAGQLQVLSIFKCKSTVCSTCFALAFALHRSTAGRHFKSPALSSCFPSLLPRFSRFCSVTTVIRQAHITPPHALLFLSFSHLLLFLAFSTDINPAFASFARLIHVTYPHLRFVLIVFGLIKASVQSFEQRLALLTHVRPDQRSRYFHQTHSTRLITA